MFLPTPLHYVNICTVGNKKIDPFDISTDFSFKQLTQYYECPQGNEENAVNLFLNQLQQEELVIVIDDKLTDSPLPQNWKNQIMTNGSKTVFNAPVLNKYTDMQDLLILDPIHEVDATGWPSTKPSE